MKAICKVCELMDNDQTEKEVYWCGTCKQFICFKCEPNLLRRGLAMLKNKTKRKKL